MSSTATETTQKSAKTKTKAPRKKAAVAADALSFPYAVIRTGGKQYRVAQGDMLLVEKLESEVGATWTAEEVLFVASNPGDFQVGKPTVKGATVTCEVLQQTLDKKILIRHHRRRQSSQKTLGHRQPLTRLVVKSIKA